MADADGPIQYFRRCGRRQYLTRYEQERRARAKSEGARRVDVTLDAKALDDYATVRSYLKSLNRLLAERPAFALAPSTRLSDTEVIRLALSYAASSMQDDDDQAAKSGRRRFLDE
jgi:hypothetical protein